MARKRSSAMADSSGPKTPPRRRTMTAPASLHLHASNGVSVEDEIRNLAYQKWQEAGCPDGDGVYFWLEAEAELQRK
jgi:Protein of unknown function (DUF2934)